MTILGALEAKEAARHRLTMAHQTTEAKRRLMGPYQLMEPQQLTEASLTANPTGFWLMGSAEM